MFLFAEDFQDARFVDIPDEQALLAAVARFKTIECAYEVRNKLHGKFNSTSNTTMIVEILQSSNGQGQHRASTSADGSGLTRQLSNAASSRGSSASGGNGRQSSRYFQSMGEKVAPISIPQTMQDGDEPSVNSQSYFSPISPQNTSFRDNTRISGKSVINEDADDETRELLNDPVAYAKNNHGGVRRSDSNSHAPISRMGSLSLNTSQTNSANGGSNMMPSAAGFGPGRNLPQHPASPTNEMSPTALTNGFPPMSPTGAGNSYPISPNQFQQRHHYPPANPADQNPPCNTLYVGNLPIDTSEDELKAMFSKQRGYKRLCFRTKHNGPMCFVEFEDVSFATKALNELYGHPLHNSIKGGIRLSFSKNPLGVRTGQGAGMNPASPLGSPGGGLGGLGAPPGFPTASGPPPGLAMPPGLNSPPVPTSAMGANGGFHSFFGPSSPPVSSHVAQRGRPGTYMGAGGHGYQDGIR